MWTDNIRHIYIVESTEECGSNYHQQEHEPEKKEVKYLRISIKNRTYLNNGCYGGDVLSGHISPHHVINHLSDGDLQGPQGLMGRQDVGKAGEAEHAGDGKQDLGEELWVLLSPVVSH